MMIPEEPEPITQLSHEQRVFIYNVGPWRFQQELGSYGTRTIPGLAEEFVFKGPDGKPGLSVAGPLVIDGLPKEYYQAEGEARVIYHRPPKNQGPRSSRPGYDFALEVCGRGKMVNKSCDLFPYGVFISDQLEQELPDKGANKEQWAAYSRWKKDVETAQKSLRAQCSKMCQEANQEHARNNFREVRKEELYQAARLINGTEIQYGWLKDTGDKADNKECFVCGTVIKGHALKCPQCGTQQVTDAEMQAALERRAKMAL